MAHPKKLYAQLESCNDRENSGKTKEARHNLNADPNQRGHYTQLK